MTEESKMVPPGDLANADAATPKSAAVEQVWKVQVTASGIISTLLYRSLDAATIAYRQAVEARDAFNGYRNDVPPSVELTDGNSTVSIASRDITTVHLIDAIAEIASYHEHRRAIEALAPDGASSASTTDASQIPGMNPDQLATHP